MNFLSNSWMHQIKHTWRQIVRRRAWLPQHIRGGAVFNLARNLVAFSLQSTKLTALPSIVKIDISPTCTLSCPTCLHANPEGRNRPLLSAQRFPASDRMDVEHYNQIIKQITGKAVAVSLFYYGDPLAHPNIAEFIKIAVNADLAVHITSHLSYNMPESRIAALVDAGLSHITVAVDGATQDIYEVTRVGGRLDWVMRNLERLVAYRNSRGLVRPTVEVQHIRHPHHPLDERERVEKLVRAIGIDEFVTFEGLRYDKSGDLFNVVDNHIISSTPGKPMSRAPLPRCHWPYSSTVIKFDGRVIPCCMWREGQQYAENGEDRAVGNVFEQSLTDIWQGSEYQKIRQEVKNPRKFVAEGNEPSFCEGCFRLYESTPLIASDKEGWHAK